MLLHLGRGPHRHNVVVSLCDYSGSWPKPYADDPSREAYTKRTAIWGTANKPKTPAWVAPVVYERIGKNGRVHRGSWMWANLGGKSERTKTLRSMTPTGFARAFCAANP